MNKTESIKAIAPAFLKAQAAMKAAPKDAKNPHFNSAYADFASVVEAVKGPLNDNGIAYLQPVRLTADGVEIETVLLHVSGESMSETLVIPLTRRDAQSVGSAISYGKRYGLQSICGLASEDDDGNGAMGDDRPQQRQAQRPPQRQQREQPPQPAPAKASREQVDELRKLLSAVRHPDGIEDKWLDAAGVKSLADMPADVIAKCIAKCQQWPLRNAPEPTAA